MHEVDFKDIFNKILTFLTKPTFYTKPGSAHYLCKCALDDALRRKVLWGQRDFLAVASYSELMRVWTFCHAADTKKNTKRLTS